MVVPGSTFRLPLYRGSPSARLWRRLAAGGLALAVALACGGCSFSYQIDNMFAKKDEDPTGSVGHTLRAAPVTKLTAELPQEGDLVIARAAATEVLTRGGKDASMPWENPKTGARGTVTPIAQAYSQDGFTCRDFLASYVRDGNESWLQGEACRVHQGKWEVRHLKPWQRT